MANKCLRCKLTVYATERFPGMDTCWHKNCFKCSNERCGTLLNLKTYVSFGDKIFCKNHMPAPRATLVTKNVAQKANFGDKTGGTTSKDVKTPTKEADAKSTPAQAEQRARSSSTLKGDEVSVSDNDMKAIIERGANCKRCGIQVVGIATVAAGNVFHEACFACIKCTKPILPGHSFTCEGADGDPTCADCVPSVKCTACNKQIVSEYLVTGYGGNLHSQCHVCCVCKSVFGTEEYIVTDGKAYCKKDNPVAQLSDCAACGKAVDEGVEALDKMWHQSAFSVRSARRRLPIALWKRTAPFSARKTTAASIASSATRAMTLC
eukprot:Opistho-2@2780